MAQLSEYLKKKQSNLQIYYDSLIFRGKLYMKQKEFTKAFLDFKEASLLEFETVN